MDLARCRAYVGHATNKHICAGGVDGEDSCNGDSGGPLVGVDRINEQMFLLGVVSSGTPKCGVGQPGLYTKFALYEEWIRNNLKP